MRRRNTLLTLLILLTPVAWVGFLYGLLQRRRDGIIQHQRGLWLLLRWPVVQVWRGHGWVCNWCPWLLGVLTACYFIGGIWRMSAVFDVLTTTPPPPLLGQWRYQSATVDLAGAGRITWRLGDTEAEIQNTDTTALKCATTEKLYGGGAEGWLIHQGQTWRGPAATLLAGVFCAVCCDAQSVGVRVGPAASAPSPSDSSLPLAMTGTASGTPTVVTFSNSTSGTAMLSTGTWTLLASGTRTYTLPDISGTLPTNRPPHAGMCLCLKRTTQQYRWTATCSAPREWPYCDEDE